MNKYKNTKIELIEIDGREKASTNKKISVTLADFIIT